jgi:Copper binding proteins, plastocyanin/azurin family
MKRINHTGMRTRGAIAAALLGALALLGPGSSEAAPPKLIGTVGPGFTISLKTAAGKNVTTLKRGTYAITIKDRSRMHDFRLRGPGVNRVFSSVAAVGTKTATVRLAAGRYEFVCQPHAGAMHGAFRVT